jgi:hypothetical protein
MKDGGGPEQAGLFPLPGALFLVLVDVDLFFGDGEGLLNEGLAALVLLDLLLLNNGPYGMRSRPA